MMSSATSIRNSGVRLSPANEAPADKKGNRVRKDTTAPEGADAFRPWHFFVLASLIAATAAVVLSRESTPEHLVLVSVTIATAGLAAAGFYRMLAPLAAADATMFSEPLSERTRATLEREKTLTLRSIKELEFDRAMGKLSQKDFDEMGGRLRSRALLLMAQLEEGTDGYRTLIERELDARLRDWNARKPDAADRLRPEAAPDTEVAGHVQMESEASGVACACGIPNDADAVFCKRCGAKLAQHVSSESGNAR